ncbi:MAG: hypothetical protein IMY73_02220 [Bacteroidetes bacterium]|nr:hypothetical protein [Bacteroidota bacterium]
MRSLTQNEKKLVKVILQKYDPSEPINVGELLCSVYDIKEIRVYEPTEYENNNMSREEYHHINFKYYEKSERNFESEIYEAILLLHLLNIKDYLFFQKKVLTEYCDFKIGNNDNDNKNFKTTRLYDIFPNKLDLWALLNSRYIVANSLNDYYKKEFKTVEQRRFDKTILLMKVTIVASIIVSFFSLGVSIYIQLFK